MHIKHISASGVLQFISITTVAALFIILPAFSVSAALLPETTPSTSDVWSFQSLLTFLANVITIAAIMISEFYFSYIHGAVVSLISAVWPEQWPQYEPMLAAYQALFYKIPLWFTGNFWPSSWFGHFPLWGIDLFLITEILYIALRLVTHKAAPFKGSWFVKFLKSMVYETWIFIKAPFFAASSLIFFIIRGEKEKRRILFFWLYSMALTAIVIAIVAWYAHS